MRELRPGEGAPQLRALLSAALILLASAAPAMAAAEPAQIDLEVIGTLADEHFADLEPGGAVVVLVAGGRVALARGYGFADAASTRPVDPARTLFYIGSVTKVFTATAALQLLSEERLSLDGDINEFLGGLRIPPKWGAPVTLTDLLTHTAGFEDRNIGYAARTAAEALPLSSYLARSLPARVRPPGAVHAYSNHGYGLIGRAIEVASGGSYAEYLDERIFGPLGMDSTTARVPPPAVLAGQMAVGFHLDLRTGEYREEPLGARNLPPAGSISTTGADMARFMTALLADGTLEGARILPEGSLERMARTLWSPRPGLPGMAFGWFQRPHGGRMLLEHRGAFIGFQAQLVLAPGDGFGLFVAASRSHAGLGSLVQEILDETFGPDVRAETGGAPSSAAPPGGERDLPGLYLATRSSRSSLEKIALWDASAVLAVAEGGGLALTPRNSASLPWLAEEGDLYRSPDHRLWMTVQREPPGRRPVLTITGDGAIRSLEKAGPLEDTRLQLPLLQAMLGLALTAVILWPLSLALGRWRRGHRRAPRGQRLAAMAGVAAGLMQLVVLGGIDATLGNSAYRTGLIYGMTKPMVIFLWAILAAAALSVLLAIPAAVAWRRSFWSLPSRIYFSLLALNGLLFAAFLYNWNLLGFLY